MRSAIWGVVLLFALGCYGSSVDDDGGTDDTAAGADADADGDDGSGPPATPPVDILLLIDTSGSVAQEQMVLTAHFPELLEELVNPTDADGDGRPDHPAVTDIHVGVISHELGTAGYVFPSCVDEPGIGDNGCLLATPNSAVGGCAPSYPNFLDYDPASDPSYSPEMLAQDFTCIGTLGTNGCGPERAFEAMERATTTNVEPRRCNEGFLRPDSVLVLIFEHDEDDCSPLPEHPEMLDPYDSDLGPFLLRCFLHPEYARTVESFAAAFRGLRTDHPERLVVGMIVGVPPDAPQCIGSGESLGDCLAVPAMVEQVNPSTPTMLIPSCNDSMGLAFPPVRFVRLALLLGDAAYVGSVCETDWRETIRGIARKIGERLGPAP
jgi:hypothetical protein